MNEFIAKYQDEIIGALTGFDRLVFRGSLRNIAYANGMDKCRTLNGVLLKDFGKYAEQASRRLEEESLEQARRQNCAVEYLRSSRTDKEEMARRIATERGITDGLVCVLRCIEPCASFEVYRNRNQSQLELKSRLRKCMHLYHYQFHPVLGWMNARVQTWFPFSIQICMNGREWLARQLDRTGTGYVKHDNCMAWVQDWQRAQCLLDEQLKVNWPSCWTGSRLRSTRRWNRFWGNGKRTITGPPIKRNGRRMWCSGMPTRCANGMSVWCGTR